MVLVQITQRGHLLFSPQNDIVHGVHISHGRRPPLVVEPNPDVVERRRREGKVLQVPEDQPPHGRVHPRLPAICCRQPSIRDLFQLGEVAVGERVADAELEAAVAALVVLLGRLDEVVGDVAAFEREKG